MKQIVNNIIPFKGFLAITFWPFIFTRKPLAEKDENHENIHGEQQKEMLIVGTVLALLLFLLGYGWFSLLALPVFFWWYIVEWLVRIFINGNAYRNISFEREAYANERNMGYIKTRKPFAWLGYIWTK